MSTSGTQEANQNSQKRIHITYKDFIFIATVVLTEIGCNISLDTPGSLENAIKENYGLTTYQFSLFYSLYYVPTIVFNGFSGFLIDRIMGIKLSTFVYSIVGIIGLVLFAVGGVTNHFWLMLMGRLIFGLGNELSTNVCVNYCVFYWYSNSIMNLASSISNDGSVGGTTIMYQVAPRLFNYFKGFLPEKESLNIVIILGSALFIVTSALAVTLTFLKPQELPDFANIDNQTDLQTKQNERKATFKDIMGFPLVYWILFCLNFLAGSLQCFSSFSQGLLTSEELNLSVEEAGNVVSAMGIVKIALSIPISLSVDLLGRNTWYVIIGQAIGTLAYFLFILKVTPYAGMVLVGISNSFYYAAIMPMYAYPVEKHLIGSCYGLISVAGGISMFASPLIVGVLIDSFKYYGAIYYFFSGSSLCLLCSILVLIQDKRSTGILSMTPKERIQYQRKKHLMSVTEQETESTFSTMDTPEYNSTLNLWS